MDDVSGWERLREVMQEQKDAEVEYERKKKHLAAHLKLAVNDLYDEGQTPAAISEAIGRIWLEVHRGDSQKEEEG